MNPFTISCMSPIQNGFIIGMPVIELSLSEIPVEKLFRVNRNGLSIVVFSTGARVSAFVDVCPHAHWPLSDGELEDNVVECPGHGWRFSLATGRCLNAPTYCLTPVQVKIEGNRVRLEFSQPVARDDQQCSEARNFI
jgi:nitrite reductase/ring-hydroxylating ferredoxin subunit